MISNPGIAAGWRRRVVALPCVHVGNHGAPEIPDWQRRLRALSEFVACSFLRREWNGEMLQPGKVVDAHPVGNRGILLSIGAHVDESGGSAPVFISSIGEEDLRHDLVLGRTIEQARRLSSHGIFLWLISKRKNIRGEEDGGSGLRVARRLGEAIVEAAAACSG